MSLSDGSLALLRNNDSSRLQVTDTWAAHDFEPWIAAWDYWNTNVVYSGKSVYVQISSSTEIKMIVGGDDLKMKGWDIRQDLAQPTFVNQRYLWLLSKILTAVSHNMSSFDAGVTTIQSHPHIEHLLAVGRYARLSIRVSTWWYVF